MPQAPSLRPALKTRLRTLSTLVVAALLCAAHAASALAANTPFTGLLVIPHPTAGSALSYLKSDGLPGRVVSAGSIELVNVTQKSMRVALTPVDGQTLDTLGSAYGAPGLGNHGATRWIELSARRLRLEAGAKAFVSVSVGVPASARAGDYLSGISIEDLGQRSPQPTQGLATASTLRYAIGVETSIAGARHPLLRFRGATLRRDPAGLTFLLLADNLGNSILKGVHGHVLITSHGHKVLSRSIPAGTFLAHTRIAYPVPAPGQHPSAGARYGIQALLDYPGGSTRLSTSVTFGRRAADVQRHYQHQSAGGRGGDDWPALGLAGALVYGLATTIMLLRRRGRRRDAPAHAGQGLGQAGR